MQNNQPLDWVQPWLQAERNKSYSWQLASKDLPRVMADENIAEFDNVDINLEFYYEKNVDSPVVIIKGSFSCKLVCRRNGSQFKFSKLINTQILFTTDYNRCKEFENDYEIIDCNDTKEKVSLKAIIEDTILLEIPIYPVNEAEKIPSIFSKSKLDIADNKQMPFKHLDKLIKSQ